MTRDQRLRCDPLGVSKRTTVLIHFITRSRCIWVIIFGVSLLVGSCFGQTISPASADARPAQAGKSLGSPDFKPAPDRPVGWRGDWSGRFPGASPPMEWSRRAKGLTSEIKYQAGKPSGE